MRGIIPYCEHIGISLHQFAMHYRAVTIPDGLKPVDKDFLISIFEALFLLFDLSGPPPNSDVRTAWAKARARCEEIREYRNVADLLYPPGQQEVDSRNQKHTHRASTEGPGMQEFRPRYRDFAAEPAYQRAAEERRTANFLAQNDATPSSIPMPPPPPNVVPPPIDVQPGWQPPPPKHPPPQEMMASVYWGVPPHEVDITGGSRYGFRNVERGSRM